MARIWKEDMPKNRFMEREGISPSGKTQYAFGGAVLSEKTHLPAARICPLTSCRYHQKIWCAGVGPAHAE
jgi:hypothetical protein